MPDQKIVIDQHWLDVLIDLDKQMKAKGNSVFLPDPSALDKLSGETLSFLELTAIASTKNEDAIHEKFPVSYEEDEDCNYAQTENSVLRGGLNGGKIFTFEVAPIYREHPQMVLKYGFIVAKNHAEAKEQLIALPDAKK